MSDAVHQATRTGGRLAAAAVFGAAAMAGSVMDRATATSPAAPAMLAGDFHIHGMPGDGALPVWEIQREAVRRGLDVIAITNHDDNLSYRIAQASGLLKPYPIVIPGQELTTSRFHIAAIGVRTMVSATLSAQEAFQRFTRREGRHRCASLPRSWREDDEAALRMLDGSEVSHPIVIGRAQRGAELLQFFQRARRLNPDIAPIASTDFHLGNPLGLCGTYLMVDEVSEAGVLDAIRRGRTVASGIGDRLVGDDDLVSMVKAGPRRAQPASGAMESRRGQRSSHSLLWPHGSSSTRIIFQARPADSGRTLLRRAHTPPPLRHHRSRGSWGSATYRR